MVAMADRLNDMDGKTWLKYSFSIWRDIKKSPFDTKGEHPASFPVELPSRLIRMFTHKGETVLDPFMGSGSTRVASLLEGRNGIGVELSKEFYDFSKDRLNSLALEKMNNPEISVDAFNDSVLNLSKIVKPETADFCVTSPPYWDVLNMKRSADKKASVNYSNSPEDLGNINDYETFINHLSLAFSKVDTALKRGAYCAIIVMDIRKGGNFYPFHLDVSRMMMSLNYQMKDIIIWDRQNEYNNMRPLGYPYSFIINKVHEYILLFRKGK
jgi:DNA modification methylase